MNIVVHSTLTCPECGHRHEERMPEDACLFFYQCAGCNTMLKPRDGDCCVFCSYGTVKCPSVQQATAFGDKADDDGKNIGCRC